jgi:hypothetical protein
MPAICTRRVPCPMTNTYRRRRSTVPAWKKPVADRLRPGRPVRRGCAGSPGPGCPVPSPAPARTDCPVRGRPGARRGRAPVPADETGVPAQSAARRSGAAGPARPGPPGQPTTAPGPSPAAGARPPDDARSGSRHPWPGRSGRAGRTPTAPQGRRTAGTRVLKVPQRTANPQPDAELALPWPGRKDQFNDSDRIIGTHRT